MCTILTQLAYSSDFRCIYHCEHNTIHLTWDNATTYLDLETLAYVVEITEEGQTFQIPKDIQYGLCRLFYTGKGDFQIWIRNVGLKLSRADFEIFADLVRVAFKKVVSPTAQSETTQSSDAYQHTVKASIHRPFSNN